MDERKRAMLKLQTFENSVVVLPVSEKGLAVAAGVAQKISGRSALPNYPLLSLSSVFSLPTTDRPVIKEGIKL